VVIAMDDARKQEIMANARATLRRLSDERIEEERRETAEMVWKHATGERQEWQAPEEHVREPSLPPHELARVKAWVRQSQPVSGGTMTPEQQEPWDKWFDARFKQCLIEQIEKHGFLYEMLAEVLSIMRHEQREDIGALRADIEVLRQHKASKDADNVAPIRGRDAA
jgi:hypothetical protein